MTKKTIFSKCRLWRYQLWRMAEIEFSLNDNAVLFKPGFVQFICLNPSTADENKDDATLRRCQDFTKRWGYREMVMTNLFAFRSTDPAMMKKYPWPVGENKPQAMGKSINVNDEHILACAKDAALIVCAWGTHGDHKLRGRDIHALLKLNGLKIHNLGKNDDGTPCHPLYLPKTTMPIIWD